MANGIDDDKKKIAVFLTVIGAQAYALLRNLLAPTKPASKKYEVLVVMMKDHLKPKPSLLQRDLSSTAGTRQRENLLPSIWPS